MKLCAYCGDPLPDRTALDDDGKPVVNVEHVFPDAVGGTLEIRVHRKKCNTPVNKLVDEPFVKSKLMEWFRCHHKIEGSRGRGAPWYEFEFPTQGWGPTVVVRCGPNGEREVVARDQYEKHPDGVLAAFGSVSTDPDASHEEAVRRRDEWVAAVQAGATARGEQPERLGPEVHTRVLHLPERPPAHNENVEIILRELAKVALGVTAWCLGDDWISGENAALLRAFVRGERPRGDVFGEPPMATAFAMRSTDEAIQFPHFPDGFGPRALYRVLPNEHAFGFFSRDDGMWCAVEMFQFIGGLFRISPIAFGHDRAWALNFKGTDMRSL